LLSLLWRALLGPLLGLPRRRWFVSLRLLRVLLPLRLLCSLLLLLLRRLMTLGFGVGMVLLAALLLRMIFPLLPPLLL
jgi:hypothetical protein